MSETGREIFAIWTDTGNFNLTTTATVISPNNNDAILPFFPSSFGLVSKSKCPVFIQGFSSPS